MQLILRFGIPIVAIFHTKNRCRWQQHPLWPVSPLPRPSTQIKILAYVAYPCYVRKLNPSVATYYGKLPTCKCKTACHTTNNEKPWGFEDKRINTTWRQERTCCRQVPRMWDCWVSSIQVFSSCETKFTQCKLSHVVPVSFRVVVGLFGSLPALRWFSGRAIPARLLLVHIKHLKNQNGCVWK